MVATVWMDEWLDVQWLDEWKSQSTFWTENWSKQSSGRHGNLKLYVCVLSNIIKLSTVIQFDFHSYTSQCTPVLVVKLLQSKKTNSSRSKQPLRLRNESICSCSKTVWKEILYFTPTKCDCSVTYTGSNENDAPLGVPPFDCTDCFFFLWHNGKKASGGKKATERKLVYVD